MAVKMKNIILIGFMGSGKTSVGIRLSYRLRRTLTDTDKKIERLYRIISVGGGLPMRDCNRELLKRLGWVVYLRVKPLTVCERLEADTSRPLLQGEDREEKVRSLLEQRAPVYESAADIIIDVDGKIVDEIADEILQNIGIAT